MYEAPAADVNSGVGDLAALGKKNDVSRAQISARYRNTPILKS